MPKTLGLVAFVIACFPNTSAIGQGLGGSCTAVEVSRQTLRDETGMEMYVEPVAFGLSNGVTFLAGTPNYVYGPGATGLPGAVVRDSVFGMVISESGSSRTVTSPVGGLPVAIRILPRTEGGWDVVFAEFPANYNFPDRVQPVALWYGVLQGTRWSTIERIPLPSRGRLDALSASSLVRHGDTISWAITYDSDSEEGAALFERRADKWVVELVPIPGIVLVSLATSQRDGLLLIPIRGIAATGQANRPFLYSRNPTWQALREIDTGGSEPVFDIQATAVNSGAALTWWSLMNDTSGRREARASVGALDSPAAPVIQLDPDVASVRAVPLQSGNPLWVIHGPKTQSAEMEIRIIATDLRGGRQTLRIDDPFEGPFTAMESAPSMLVLAGPLLRRDGQWPTLVTLLLRMKITCAP